MAPHILQLTGQIDFGAIKAPLSIDFSSSGTPTVLLITVPSNLTLSALVEKLFGSVIPAGVFDVSFSNLLLYYAWTSSVKTPEANIASYSPGFHGQAHANVYGIDFTLGLDVLTSDTGALGGHVEDGGGVVIKGTKDTPVEVLGITLRDKTVKEHGPSIALSTLAGTTSCYIEAEVVLFGTDIGSAKLSYDSKNKFSGEIDVRASFFPGGHASVTVELVKTAEGKHRLRIAKLPAIFNQILEAEEIIKKIEELSAADGSCGPVTLVFQEQFKATLNVDINLHDSEEQSPEKGSLNGATQLTVDLVVRLDLSIAGKSVAEIELGTFPVNIEIPNDISSFGDGVVKALTNMAGKFIEALWTNPDNFKILLGVVASNLLSGKTLSSLICRKRWQPKSEPNPDQKPDKKDDDGGKDGDESSGRTGGSSAGAGAQAAGATATTLASIIAALLASGKIHDNKSSPPEPRRVSGPPPSPSSDPIGEAIRSTLDKKFDRWKDAKDYKAAIKAVLDCALDYRAAIAVLRKVLRSDEIVPRLPKDVYDDYKMRLPMLLYDFTMLSKQFADRWLDLSKLPGGVGFDGGSRTVDVTWWPEQADESVVTLLTVWINGELKAERQSYKDNHAEFHVPEGAATPLQVHAQVDIVAAIWGGDPKYVFYSQGKPGTLDY